MAVRRHKLSAKETDYIIGLFREGKLLPEVQRLTGWHESTLRQLRTIARQAA